ncbi:GPI-GlcNAc transferase subunit P [Trichophyton rubrum]|uniref:GPI-GlcNAc transferase subunit P n=1 Tax=Trichophyton rubrum TaxID=5551 RepID=A0A178F2U4_TRIRU|nr:GPI-GlcNAc transferase subunit P [Trichophyton rubrum]
MNGSADECPLSPKSVRSVESSQPFPPLSPDLESLNYIEEEESRPEGDDEERGDAIDKDDAVINGEGDDEVRGTEEAEFLSQYSPQASGSEDEDEGEDEGEGEESSQEEENFAIDRPYIRSTVSLPHAFAPPFYNRPPTPLPPSPSLTSLLRPSFSATTSRPTTPDSSDVETPNDTEAAVAKSARNATTVPRASPKVPTYEYYGFVLYLASSLAFSIPSFLVMTIIYIYVALAAYNTGYLTLPMNSIENLIDDAANIAVIDSKGRRRPGGSAKMNPDAATAQIMGSQKRIPWDQVWNEGTDAVMDIPIGGVCEVLYGGDDVNESNSRQY